MKQIREMVVQVGTEGGTVTLTRAQTQAGGWQFLVTEDEGTLLSFLSDEDRAGFGDTIHELGPVATWEEALALLGRYPLERMTPVVVHQDFRPAVWGAVVQRQQSRKERDEALASICMESWRRFCFPQEERCGTRLSKPDARALFARLERLLNSAIPPPDVVRAELAATVRKAKVAARRTPDRHSTFEEGAFLNSYVIRLVHGFLKYECGLTSEDATLALLSESYRSHREWSSGSPVRPGSHPFRKFTASPKEVMDTWRGRTARNSLARNCCPDLALRGPGPIRAVFEAKYHGAHGVGTAETALVESIYQAFFYLALPHLEQTKTHAAWNYEYACVLAYDASADRAMSQAWQSLSTEVKDACWTGANVYVMILGGGRTST